MAFMEDRFDGFQAGSGGGGCLQTLPLIRTAVNKALYSVLQDYEKPTSEHALDKQTYARCKQIPARKQSASSSPYYAKRECLASSKESKI